ncbi:MAG: hypothetical protein Q8O30_10070 [Candidatus Omnitrophota bacterium]|nr:hypothetical protein [Candidatus Omnitrophota bacterium]
MRGCEVLKFDFSKGEGVSINVLKPVKVKVMNNIIEVVSIQRVCRGLENVLRLSKIHYMILDTGEVLEYNLSENRADNIAGLKDTFRKVRDLINTNFKGGENELHLTLTYRENMKDIKQLYNDFKDFWKRYKYKYGDDIDYLSVIEPQGRGAWHCHVLIRHNDGMKVFIPSNDLEKLWGHGFIKIKSLKGVDNIGAYLSAYLCDVELTNENFKDVVGTHIEIKEVDVQGTKKRFIKGGRLHMYPSGMNLYRSSKGIVFPEVKEVEYKEVKKIVGSAKPDYTRTITIIDDEDDNKILNQITYEHYNMKRKNLK